MTEDKQADKKQSKAEKETRKVISDDVENFFRDVWGRVVEYASIGAEEATKVSVSAKTRVDIETLKFKRGKVVKMLGERYWELVTKDDALTVAGTGEIIRQIKGIDKEIKGLEKEMAAKTQKSEKKTAKKKAAPKKPPKKPAAAKKASPKKAPVAKKASPKKTPTAKKPAAAKSTPEETAGVE